MENWGQRSCVVDTSFGLIRRNHKQTRKAEVRSQVLYKSKQGDLDMVSLPEETPPTVGEPVSISLAPMSSPSSPVPRGPALAPPSPMGGKHVSLIGYAGREVINFRVGHQLNQFNLLYL